eukprot:534298-Prymnesium_polylepis.3
MGEVSDEPHVIGYSPNSVGDGDGLAELQRVLQVPRDPAWAVLALRGHHQPVADALLLGRARAVLCARSVWAVSARLWVIQSDVPRPPSFALIEVTLGGRVNRCESDECCHSFSGMGVQELTRP